MGNIRNSLSFSFAEKYSVMVLQFASSLILARLLTPEDIGIFSVGAVIVGFAHMIRDFGIANYLVQEQILTQDRIRTALGVTMLIAWSTASVLFLLSDYIADFYTEPGIQKIINILAFSFLFIPFSSTVLGLLRRGLVFKTLFLINFCTAIVHSITGIMLANLGYGFESLAWASFASAATTVIMGVILRPAGAQFLPSLKEFKQVFKFGSFSSAANLMQEAGTTAPDLAIGKLLGFSSLGLYSRAFGFVSIFNYAITSAITPVVIPAFAQAHRQGEPMKKHYLLAANYYTALAWPFFTFTLIMAAPLITLLYGDQWTVAAPIAQLLSIAFILQALSVFAGNYLVATGLIKLYFKSQLVLQIPRIIITALAAFHSLTMVALVQIIFYAVSFAVYHLYVHRSLEIKLLDFLAATYKSAVLAAVCAALTLFGSMLCGDFSNITLALVISIIFALTWLAAVFGLSHDLKNEIKEITKKFCEPDR